MPTLSAALERTALVHARRPAMLEDDRRFTWAEWRERVARLAAALAGRGVAPGQRFGVLGPNSVRQAEIFHAAFWLGATPVPVNTRLAAAEIASLLRSTGCRWVAVDPAAAPVLQAPELRDWSADALWLDRARLDAAIAATAAMAPIDRRSDSEALLLNTGGTAGRAKCVVLTHAQILANALQVDMAWRSGADDVALHVAPMFHSADLVMTAHLLQGAAHAYLPRFTPAEWLAAVERHRVTATMVVPAMLTMLVESGEIARFDIRSLKRLLYGASPMPRAAVVRAMQALPDVAFTQGYGLTETAPILTMLDDAGHRELLDGGEMTAPMSCGRALPAVELRIRDGDGRDLPPGQAGEVVARGPNIFERYHDLPEHSAEVLRGGWFHTGDIGRLDEAGRLYILDRKKDVVIVNGEKVYSIEVEAALLRHPGVAEAAVIGLPSLRQGESVLAVVVRAAGSPVQRRELREHCRQLIGAYKIPTGFVFVDALPRTPLGKVRKDLLRQQHGKAPEG